MLDLVDEHIHLAVRVGALPDSTFVATTVGRIRSVVCDSPKHERAAVVPTEDQHGRIRGA